MKILSKHVKPEISSLLHAVKTDQTRLVQIFHEMLKKTLERNFSVTDIFSHILGFKNRILSYKARHNKKTILGLIS